MLSKFSSYVQYRYRHEVLLCMTCAVELRASNEPSLTLTTLERSSHSLMLDQEEELLTFFHHVPQWLCYLEGPAAGARWLFPDGTSDDRVAVDDELITRVAVILCRGSHTQQS